MTDEQTSREADVVYAALDALGLSAVAEKSILDAWEEDGLPGARRALARYKATPPSPAYNRAVAAGAEGIRVALKQAGAEDVIDAALARGRQTAISVAQQGGDQQVADDIDQLFTLLAQKYGMPGATGGGSALTDSGVQSKAARSADPPNPWRTWSASDDLTPRP